MSLVRARWQCPKLVWRLCEAQDQKNMRAHWILLLDLSIAYEILSSLTAAMRKSAPSNIVWIQQMSNDFMCLCHSLLTFCVLTILLENGSHYKAS